MGVCRPILRSDFASMISGGEKQRLAVARLLLKDSPILFFDEAVSITCEARTMILTSSLL